MAAYDALRAIWGTSGTPSGVTGTALADAMTPAEKLAAINGWTVAATIDVPATTVRGMLYALGKWGAVAQKANAARANADTSEAALACQNLYDLANTGEIVPMTNPAIAAQIGVDLAAMVAANVIDAPAQAAVLSLAASAQKWWQANGFSQPVGTADLTLAGLI
jgi:hypothetical protein